MKQNIKKYKTNFKKITIHPQAIVDSKNIDAGTKIWAFTHILKGAIIGKNCNICEHVFIEDDVVIKDNVTIKCGVYLWNGIRIDNNVFIGPSVTFTNDIRPRSQVYPKEFMKTEIKEGASIGANVTVLCGIIIGKWAMIGAGSLVSKSIPDYALAYGNPARIKGFVCECSKDLNIKGNYAKCSCGKIYKFKNNTIVGIK